MIYEFLLLREKIALRRERLTLAHGRKSSNQPARKGCGRAVDRLLSSSSGLRI